MSITPILQMRTIASGSLNKSSSPTPAPELQITAHRTHCQSFLMPSLLPNAFQIPWPKPHDPSFLTSFCGFMCSKFLSVLEVASDTHTSIPSIFTWNLR